MGHIPLTGDEGLIRWLGRHPTKQRVLVHINNTNPILREDAAERLELEGYGITVGEDGATLEL